jgi:hypothetical protein
MAKLFQKKLEECILGFMKTKKRQKLCQNCEGDIDLDVIVCPYCAADLREEKPEERGEKERLSYLNPRAAVLPGEQAMSHSLYPTQVAPERETVIPERRSASREEANLVEETVENEPIQHLIWPILLFAVGVQLFMLGLLLFLFSSHGVLVLKWDARLWFLYLFAATPFLVFGYRELSKL